jgi:hypothetical protein
MKGHPRLLVATFILGILAIPGFVLFINHEQRQRQDAIGALSARIDVRLEQVNRALCTFRLDLQQRIDSSRAFLKTHPGGIPGISAAQIKSSINSQQRTVNALANLNCKGG